MGMIKKDTTAVVEQPNKKESGVEAAVSRLQSHPGVAEVSAVVKSLKKEYTPRDFDAEARGKTRCVMYAAALQSMAVAGTKWKTLDDLKKTIRELADDGVKYSFQD